MAMTMNFKYNEDGSMEHITFQGLNGSEFSGNLKSALELLKIENPVIAFNDKVKAGECDNMSDDEFAKLLNAMKFVSSLWRYPDAKEGEAENREMNVLMLLANVIEVASRQQAIISWQSAGYKGKET